ncbi:MAG: hypothetical protein C0483_17535 [Pirellula sp.]|nr:hypothetical protein [Pirellula sp.]
MQPVTTSAPSGPMIPLDSCWICGGKQLVRVNEEYYDMTWHTDPVLVSYHQQRFWLVECQACGFLQPDLLPAAPDYFDRLYAKDRGTDWMELDFSTPYKDFIFEGILQALAAKLPEDRRSLLDVGTHVGRMPYLAARRGWSVEAIELNPHVAAFAAQRTGLPIHQLNAHLLADTGRRYDAVTLTDVLEHIPDPMKVLPELRNLLRPGGWLSVKVPNGRNQLRKQRLRSRLRLAKDASIADSLGHINHFSPKSLRSALEKAGFRRIEITTAAPELPTFSFHPKVLLSRASRLGVYYLARMLPGGIHTPLALNLQAFAMRDE